jgi:hypothetical protein
MTATTSTLTRELDSRVRDGIEVRLLWREHDERVLVAVHDGRTGEAFSVEVADGVRPLDVFRHPFAYAAMPGARVDEPAEAA